VTFVVNPSGVPDVSRSSDRQWVATQKVASMTGHKLLTVEPYRVDEKDRSRLRPHGQDLRVVDTLGSGPERDGRDLPGLERSAHPRDREAAIDAVVIGLVDTVDVGWSYDLFQP